MAEEIRGVTWDFGGRQLEPWEAAQKLYVAGFKDARQLAIMWAVIEGESGGYTRAWHHNVVRNEDGTIFRTEDGLMEVKSTDLGFIQKNVVHDPHVILSVEGGESAAFVDDLFKAFPDYASASKSARVAYRMFNRRGLTLKRRGFTPWYAYLNGSYKKGLPRAPIAIANFLDRSFNRNDGHQIGRKRGEG